MYCSQLCRDEAGWVRYARRRRAEGRDSQAEINEVLRIRLAQVLAGGYNKRGRRISVVVRRAVFERAQAKCRICGASGEEIDHIAGSSGALGNLQLLCFERYAATPQTTFIVRPTKLSEFRPDSWWTTRAMLREGIFELEKLIAYRLRY